MHVLDLEPLDGTDPGDNHETIEAELAAHDPQPAALPRILALSKADLVAPRTPRPPELWQEKPSAGPTCRCC